MSGIFFTNLGLAYQWFFGGTWIHPFLYNTSTLCTTVRYMSTTNIQRDICHYSFRFYSRFIFGQKKKLSCTKNILCFTTRLYYIIFFGAISRLNFLFFYHTYFLYSTTVLEMFNPKLCSNLSRYYCINPRTPSDS